MHGQSRIKGEPLIQPDDWHIFPTISYYDSQDQKNRMFRLSDYTFETVDMLFGYDLSRTVRPGMRVLDIACGWKHTPLNEIARRGADAYGIDIAVEDCDTANLHLRKMDARDLQELGVFDIIYCHEFLCHMFDLDGAADYLREACSHLASGGTGLFDFHHLALKLNENKESAARMLGVKSLETPIGNYVELGKAKEAYYIRAMQA